MAQSSENNTFYLPYNTKLVTRAKQMRQNPTFAEKKLWVEYLRYCKPRF